MWKPIAAATLATLTALTFGSLPIHAQTDTTTERTTTTETQVDPAVLAELGRAANLARQAAEKANGGLGNYRAESAMFGPPSQTPYVSNGNGWTFNIKGRRPDSSEYTLETLVNVSRNGNVNVEYNGPTRSNR